MSSFPSFHRIFSRFFIVLSLLSMPAFAGQSGFSFIEFNIAFVLGLSLPVLLFAIFMRAVAQVKWGFLAAITVSVLGLLYALAYMEKNQTVSVLLMATMYLSLLCLWPLFNHREYYRKKNEITNEKLKNDEDSARLNTQEKTKARLRLINNCILVVVGSAVLFMSALFFAHSVNVFIGWIAFTVITLIIHGLSIIRISKEKSRFSVQWGLVALFSAVIYFWLNAQLALPYLVIIIVLSYLSVVVNGCWLFVQRIFAEFPVQKSIEKISSEELFTYTHDPATNLPTAQHALKYFDQMMRASKQQRFAAIVFKPINFPQVNNVLGHHNSDILLLQLAYCLQQTVANNQQLLSFDNSPEPVRLARLQSLHFLVVFDLSTTKHDDESVISSLCHQLTEAVPNAMSFKSFSLNFELAFGVAITDSSTGSINEVVAHAGDALLDAENNQKMLSYFDQKSLLHTERQLANMERLRQEIIDENLSWYLQPQVDVTDKSLYGFELKVSWQISENENVELLDFIDIAEHSGEVYLLTKQMFKRAFKTLFALNKKGLYQRVSVNLSSKTLLEPDLVDYIEQQMNNYHIAGKFLMIELSEQIVLSSSERAKHIIDQLKSLDITISIANFSGSYESLRYLRKMMIHQVKINCEQLVSTKDNHADKAIINALITLARSMSLPLIGTHIHKEESAAAFAAMGGKLIQGNIISQGIALEELDTWLDKWNNQNKQ